MHKYLLYTSDVEPLGLYKYDSVTYHKPQVWYPSYLTLLPRTNHKVNTEHV